VNKTPWSVEREFRRSVAEHEVFLSFNNDSDACDFSEWINGEGLAAFLDWQKKCQEEDE
jgi:hypothetical protein